MYRRSWIPLALPCLFLAACDRSSSGGGEDPQRLVEIEELRLELFIAGVEPLPEPPAVPDELVALGQALFFDKVLSGSEDVSCATCHLPDFATADGRTLSNGVGGLGLGPLRGGGEIVPRNSPALFGVHAKDRLFWDGHVEDFGLVVGVPSSVGLTIDLREVFDPELEVLGIQAMLPPVSRVEMRGEPGDNPLGDVGDGYGSPTGDPDNTREVWDQLTERLLDLPGYVELLTDAYPDVAIGDFTFAHAANAIAAFEARAFARTDSPFQRFVRGDDDALTRAEVRGGLAFFRAGCGQCHSGALLSDQDFHNTGMPQLGPGVHLGDATTVLAPDLGRENATRFPGHRFQFRTPSLHNVALTGPWGHAGQFAELEDMLAHYIDPAFSNRSYDIASNVDDPALVDTLVPNSDEVLATLDPRIRDGISFDMGAVLVFLHALTADDALDLADVVPETVPSGLPVF